MEGLFKLRLQQTFHLDIWSHTALTAELFSRLLCIYQKSFKSQI